VFQFEKTLTDLGENIGEEYKKSAEEKKDALKTDLEGQYIEEIKYKKEELEKVIQVLSAKVYEQAAQQQQQSPCANAGQNIDSTV
ncbi:molecular chaperone DnaK, partial [Staphylococcus aureus]|nr:molecular chaperone DnaK [Staphylococcus aureus]